MIISFLLLIVIFKCIHYFSTNGYLTECFQTSHTVDLPLNTTTSCTNFCGPTARCSTTGHQCFTDIDCPGCGEVKAKYIPDNDSGKLTTGLTPNYSPLTNGFGTKEFVISKKNPTMPNLGINTWIDDFNLSNNLFDKRYKLKNAKYMPKYSKQPTLTGQFVTNEPYPSNYFS